MPRPDPRTLGRSRSPYARALIAKAREDTTARLRREVTPQRVQRFDARMTAWSRTIANALLITILLALGWIVIPYIGG